MSLRVDSVGPEEVTKLHDSAELGSSLVEEDSSMQQPLIDQDVVPLDKSIDEEEAISVAEPLSMPHNKIPDMSNNSIDDTFLHGLPMPVVANAEVADPIDPPLTPLFEEQNPDPQTTVFKHSSLDLNPVSLFESASQEEQVRDENITPSASQPENTRDDVPVQDTQKEQRNEAAAATSVIDLSFEPSTTLPSPLAVAPVLESDPASNSWENAPNNGISTSSPSAMGVALTRNPTVPILVSDPYPYSLSTPDASLYPVVDDASEDDMALNNSVSSNSTVEKEEKEVASPNILDNQVFYVPRSAITSQEKRVTNKRSSQSQNILDNQLFYVPHATVSQQEEKYVIFKDSRSCS